MKGSSGVGSTVAIFSFSHPSSYSSCLPPAWFSALVAHDPMKGKFERLLYSVLGVVAVFVILVAINLLGGLFKVRSDLTENKLYTLSNGTKKILRKLDAPVEIRFYFSKNNASVPVPLRTYAQQVEDLLAEYQQYSRGKVKIVKLDPKPDSDAEDSANLDGIEGQAVALKDKVYLGIAWS